MVAKKKFSRENRSLTNHEQSSAGCSLSLSRRHNFLPIRRPFFLKKKVSESSSTTFIAKKKKRRYMAKLTRSKNPNTHASIISPSKAYHSYGHKSWSQPNMNGRTYGWSQRNNQRWKNGTSCRFWMINYKKKKGSELGRGDGPHGDIPWQLMTSPQLKHLNPNEIFHAFDLPSIYHHTPMIDQSIKPHTHDLFFPTLHHAATQSYTHNLQKFKKTLVPNRSKTFFFQAISGDPHLPLIENFCTIQLIPGIPGRRYRGEG